MSTAIRHRVIVGIVPDGWQPKHAEEIPPRLWSAETLPERYCLTSGVAVVRRHNRAQLAAGLVDRRWAVFVFGPRQKKGGRAL